MSDFRQFGSDFKEKARKMKVGVDSRLPKEVGGLLVDGFRDSFNMQRFNDDTSTPWQNVKRRDPSSGWYGFEYGNKKSKSNAAKTRNILYGSGSLNLLESIMLYRASLGKIVIGSDLIYANVHNEGLKAKVFGKQSFDMPERQFMGNSIKLLRQSKRIYDIFMKKILP